MPKTAAAWAELARLFREASGRFPELRHHLIELPERIPVWTVPRKVGDCPAPPLSFRVKNLLGLPFPWGPIVDLRGATDDEQRSRAAILDRLQPPLALAAYIHASVLYEPFFAILSWHEFGQEQVFYGDAGGRRAPGWRRLVELARAGVELASGTGVLAPTPPPDPRFKNAEEHYWVGTWMDLVYRLARERSPDSLCLVQEKACWDGQRLPAGMKVASLLVGVFDDASAYAADLLAKSADEIPPDSLEPKLGITVAGNDVTVAGKIYHLDDAEAAFIKELVDAGPGVWVSGPKMGLMVQPRPDRVFKDLPEPIRTKLESRTGAGYRIRPT